MFPIMEHNILTLVRACKFTITTTLFESIKTPSLMKYCNFEEYSKCILLMYPKGDVLFLHRDVTIIFGHYRVTRYNLHCKSGQ